MHVFENCAQGRIATIITVFECGRLQNTARYGSKCAGFQFASFAKESLSNGTDCRV